MGDARYRLLREGHLDIKAPPDSPERILHKAWRRLWVRAIIFLPKGRGEPHLVLQLCQRARDDEPLKQVKASRDGLRLFRCRSRSRALRCWALASGSSLLLYLAASTEEQTQQWMHALREGLWPTLLQAQGARHEVSLIDDEKSFSSGLLGVYGHLVKTSEEALSVIHPHWQGTQMRWRLDDILDVKLVRRVGDPHAGVFNLTVRSTHRDTRSLQFYSTTAVETVDWIKSLLSGLRKDGSDRPLSNLQTTTQNVQPASTPNPSDAKCGKATSETSTADSYAIVQKTRTDFSSQAEVGVETPNEYCKVDKTPGTLLPNIPDALLNASVNSLMLGHPEDAKDNQVGSGDDSDDSNTDLYDHLYEDLDLLRDSRAYTVYEEVDDDADDGEYVPPAPPTLPERLARTLELPDDQKAVGVGEDISLQQKLRRTADGAKLGLQSANGAPPNPQLLNPSQSSRAPLQGQNSQKGVDATSAAELRLQKLSESVSAALKMSEEPAPAPVETKRPSLLQKVVGKSKRKNPQASPTPDRAAAASTAPATIKRAVSESDLTDTTRDDESLPLRPFDCLTEPKKQAQRPRELQARLIHVPLEDLLRSLKTVERRQQHHHHRRGASEGGKTVFANSEPIKRSKNKSKKVASSKEEHLSGGVEEDYLDMS